MTEPIYGPEKTYNMMLRLIANVIGECQSAGIDFESVLHGARLIHKRREEKEDV